MAKPSIISRRQKVYIAAIAVEAMERKKAPPKKARGGGPIANTRFTELPRVIAQTPVQNAPAVATAHNGQAVGTYVTNSSHGTWLFAPNQNQGNGS